MSRTADITVLAKASHALLIRLKKAGMGDADIEAAQMDTDTLGILLTELHASQLKHENIQWVLWHLLEHVMEDTHDTFEGSGSEEDWNALDDYITAFEDKLASRAKIVCPRLEALLGDHWMEAEEAEQGSRLSPAGEEPEENNESGKYRVEFGEWSTEVEAGDPEEALMIAERECAGKREFDPERATVTEID